MIIHPRSDWGAPAWARQPYIAADIARRGFMIHHEGEVPTTDTGAAAMRAIDSYHRSRGWQGIGYNHVIFQDGSIWEGRGWSRIGAHCQGWNTATWGVQVHVGGDQEPTSAARRAVRLLYQEACRRTRTSLTLYSHRDCYPTLCAGDILSTWVHQGLPMEADMDLTDALVLGPGARRAIREATGMEVSSMPLGDALQRILGIVVMSSRETSALVADLDRLQAQVDTLKAALADDVSYAVTEALASLGEQAAAGLDAQAVARATVDLLAERARS